MRKLDPASQERLMDICDQGIRNANNSGMTGVNVIERSDYDRFPLIERIVRNVNNSPENKPIKQEHDWGSESNCWNLDKIDSSLGDASVRIRVARSVEGVPMIRAMVKEDRLALEQTMITAFGELEKRYGIKGKYYSLTPGSEHEIDNEFYQKLVDEKLMFKHINQNHRVVGTGMDQDWPYGRGMFLSEKRDFMVWINEEDHLRIIVMGKGRETNDRFNQLNDMINKLEAVMPAGFTHSEKYGYLANSPANAGTGMRASIQIALPSLTNDGNDITKLQAVNNSLGLGTIRGERGEHTAAGKNGLVDISPRARVGVTERETMDILYEGIKKVWEIENTPRLQKDFALSQSR